MKGKLRFFIPLLVFGVMVVFFAKGLKLDPKLVPSPLIDKPAPPFKLQRLHDQSQTFSQDEFLNQVSVFNVWASWCVACRQEHPFLMELAKQKQIPIYGLNYKDTRADALSWLSRFGNPYNASAWDNEGNVGLDWGVYGVPETFLVDRQGVIRYKYIGPISPQIWQQEFVPRINTLSAG